MSTRREMIDMLVKYKKDRDMSPMSEEEIRKSLESLSDETLGEMIDGLRPV